MINGRRRGRDRTIRPARRRSPALFQVEMFVEVKVEGGAEEQVPRIGRGRTGDGRVKNSCRNTRFHDKLGTEVIAAVPSGFAHKPGPQRSAASERAELGHQTKRGERFAGLGFGKTGQLGGLCGGQGMAALPNPDLIAALDMLAHVFERIHGFNLDGIKWSSFQ